MGKYVTRLEKIFKQLETQSPWTKNESKDLSKRDKVFIRNLQIKDKSSKVEATEKYKNIIIKGPAHYKKLQKDVTSYVKDLYPVHDKKFKTETKEPKRSGKKGTKIKPTEFKKIVNKSVSQKVKIRLTNAHKKYPDASVYELRYGVNSAKSQQYRIKNGGESQYEGRIINDKK